MKLSYEEKLEIYNDWKVNHKSPDQIARERNLDRSTVQYLVRLADRHGVEILQHRWTYYSPEFKEAAIKRVLIGRESEQEVSLDLGLASHETIWRCKAPLWRQGFARI